MVLLGPLCIYIAKELFLTMKSHKDLPKITNTLDRNNRKTVQPQKGRQKDLVQAYIK